MPRTSLFNILTKIQSWLWWFYFIGGLSWPHKSDLYAPTLPPTVWQSDSRKVQNVHFQDKWALKLLLYRALFLFFLSSTPIRPLLHFLLLLPRSSFYSLTLFTLVRPPSLFPLLLSSSCFALTSLVSGLFFLNNLPSLSVAPLDFAVPLPVWPQSIYCLDTYRHSDCTVLQCWFAEGIKEEPVFVICTFGFQIIGELGTLVSGQGLFLWLVISSVGYWTSRQTVLCTEAYTPVVSRQ